MNRSLPKPPEKRSLPLVPTKISEALVSTGIGLAMVCAAKGYPLVVTMAENFSIERRKLMRFLGARVVLTPAALKGSGMLAKACELAETHGWFLCRQFENEANALVHSRTTAREILGARRVSILSAGPEGPLAVVGDAQPIPEPPGQPRAVSSSSR